MGGEIKAEELHKKAEEVDRNAADGITEVESKSTKDAADFLNKNTLPPETKNKIKAKIDEHKPNIKGSIEKYFQTTDKEGKQSFDKTMIGKLTLQQTEAYISIITWLAKDPTNKINDALKNMLDEQKKALNTSEQEKSLLDILTAEPSKERAKEMFEQKQTMWDSIFTNTKQDDSDHTKNKLNLSDVQNKSFESMLKYYSSCDTANKGTDRTYGEGEVKDFSYNIRESKGDSEKYKSGEKYIQVSFNVIGDKGEKTQVIKDILFGQGENIIEEKRTEQSKKNPPIIITENKLTTNKDIQKIHDSGSYEYLRSLVNDKKVDLTASLKGGLLDNIKTFYSSPTMEITETKDGNAETKNVAVENKEDGYYTTIAELVVQQAHAGNTGAMQEYLKQVNKDDLTHLGRTPAEQQKNLRILFTAVTENSKYDANIPVWQDINKALLGLNTQVFPPKDLLEAAKDGIQPILDKYGNDLIKFLNFLGIGKATLYNICKTLGIDYKEVDEYYTKAYGLDKEATIASKGIQAKYEKTEREKNKDADKTDKKPTDAATLKTAFANTINTDKKFPTDNQDTFLQNTNPTLLHNLIIQHNKQKTDGDKNINTINEQDILSKDDKGKYKLKKDGIKSITEGIDKQNLIDILINDDNTWRTIRDANQKIAGNVSTNEKGTEKARADLDINGTRTKLMINTPQDMVKYLNYYAFSGKTGDLDYVITETKDVSANAGTGDTGETNDKPPETTKEIKDYVDGKYLDKDGALKDVEPISIDKIFLDYDKAPNNLLITPKGKQEAIKIKKGTIKGIKTYVYEDGGTRAIIHDGDKISMPEEAIKGDGKEEKEKTASTDNNQTETQNISGAVVNTPENKDKTANQTKEENNNQTNTPQGTSNTGKNDNSTTTEEVTFTAPVNNVVAANNQINSTENNSTESPDKKRQEQIIGAYRNVTDTYQKIAPKKVENIVSTVNDDNVTGKERSLMTDMYNNTKPKETGNIQDTNNTPPTGKQVVVGPTIGQSIINDMLTKKQNTATVVDATPTATVNSQANNTQDNPKQMDIKKVQEISVNNPNIQTFPVNETKVPKETIAMNNNTDQLIEGEKNIMISRPGPSGQEISNNLKITVKNGALKNLTETTNSGKVYERKPRQPQNGIQKISDIMNYLTNDITNLEDVNIKNKIKIDTETMNKMDEYNIHINPSFNEQGEITGIQILNNEQKVNLDELASVNCSVDAGGLTVDIIYTNGKTKKISISNQGNTANVRMDGEDETALYRRYGGSSRRHIYSTPPSAQEAINQV